MNLTKVERTKLSSHGVHMYVCIIIHTLIFGMKMVHIIMALICCIV